MNNVVFEKTIENIRKHRDIKLVTTERTRNYGVRSKLSYYKFFYTIPISNRNGKNADTYE